jgi:hypothetical protein
MKYARMCVSFFRSENSGCCSAIYDTYAILHNRRGECNGRMRCRVGKKDNYWMIEMGNMLLITLIINIGGPYSHYTDNYTE